MRRAIAIACLALAVCAGAEPYATGPPARNHRAGDGIGEARAGFDAPEGVLVLNEFAAKPGADAVTAIHATLGEWPHGEGTLTAVLFLDPTDNFDAGDAQLAAAVDIADPQPGARIDVRFRRAYPVSAPSGRFLVGFYATGAIARGWPVGLDRSAAGARGWAAETPHGGPQYAKPLGEALGTALAPLSNYGLSGAWAIDASAIAAECAAPVFSNVPPDIDIAADKDCFAQAIWAEPSVHDDCTTPSVAFSSAPGDRFRAGTTRVEYVATAWGDSAAAAFEVRVTESEPPEILNVPPQLFARARAGEGAVPAWTLPEVFDACSTATLHASHQPGDAFPIGESAILLRAEDAFGNAAEATIPVRIAEDRPPAIACPGTLFVAAPGAAGAIVHFELAADDDYDADPGIAAFPPPGSWFPRGRTEVLAVAEDDLGTTSTCTFDVVVGEPGRLEAASIAAEDGELRGGSVQPANSVVLVGDAYTGEQRRALFSFDTSPIPAGAVAVRAELSLRWMGAEGDPAPLGMVHAEGIAGHFGASPGLEAADFGAAAPFAAAFPQPAKPGPVAVDLPRAIAEGGAARAQVRIRFALPTDGDPLSDAALFAAGEYPSPSWRPVLAVDYLWFPPMPSATPTPVPIDSRMRR